MSDLQPDLSAQIAQVERYRPIEALIPSHWTEGSVVANGARHHYYRNPYTNLESA